MVVKGNTKRFDKRFRLKHLSIHYCRVCKNPVKFISGWPGLFSGLEILNPVRPVDLEANPGPSGPVNDRIPEFRSSGGFSGGKEKVEKTFFQRKIFEDFFFNFSFCYII